MKKRVDQRVQELYPQFTKTVIQSFIAQGKVTVNGKIVTKAGAQVKDEDTVELTSAEQKYVSRAGFKLEAALDQFGISVNNFVVLDAGLSTGGFTDCLLQHGAKKVYGIDVGYGQVHEKIRVDERVVVMERTNLRELMQLPELVDLVTLDLSFISVLKVMDVVRAHLKPQGKLIVLIKPQFEARKEQVGKGGIIKDPVLHKEIVDRVVQGIVSYSFDFKGIIESPIYGTMGNKEFLAYFIGH
jgi:23S rRNA (cytidine1920-2'-O)/16S rRNA (cytidine1409-2'-O)-methyltransferase